MLTPRSQYEPDPKAVFSQQQWAAIAKSIERDEIPQAVKQAICDALFEYTIATIKPEEANRFIEDARSFRAAASRIQKFLRHFAWHEKIEDLIEEIFLVQRFLEGEFNRRPNPKGGRPKSVARDALVYHLGLVYKDLTSEVPGLTVHPVTGELSGRFPDFTTKIFEFHGIKLDGLRDAIIKARAAIAKNA